MPDPKAITLTPKIIHMFHQNVFNTNPDECWIWQGWKDKDGYGRLTVYFEGKYQIYGAHRLSYMIHNRIQTLEHGLVLHRCPNGDNPSCVNPNHLYLGTVLENNRRKIETGTQNRGENLYRSVLTEKEVIQIRLDYNKGYSYRYLANQYGVSSHCIYSIIKRITWKHI